jgi:assimilatory nitrate reductase catalytic subunit
MAVIAGRPGAAGIDRGALVCSCYGIGANEIAAAIAQGCDTVEAVGTALKAGTNCGSCRGEIRQILEDQCRNDAALKKLRSARRIRKAG